MNKMVKLMALIGLLCFSMNAATIKVAAGASISAAITSAAAKDTILVAAGTFKEIILIDKQLSVIGVDRDSTIIMRKDSDGVDAPTMKVTAQKVLIKNLTIFGHNGFRWGVMDSLSDLNKSIPPSDAVLLTGADSTSIVSCELWAGNGINWRSLRSASGGIGLNVYKSKGLFLENDSIRGGYNDRTGNIDIDTILGDTGLVFNPLYKTGIPGYGIFLDSSSYLKADSIFVMGGDGLGINYKGFAQHASNGIFCVTAESISVASSTVYGGQSFLGVWDTSMYAVNATVGSSVKMTNCIFFSKARAKTVDATSTVTLFNTGILSFRNRLSGKNAFSIRYTGGSSRSIVLGCVLTKESFVGIDLLNAKGQSVKRIREQREMPGTYNFSIDLANGGSSLADAAYFLRISTDENSRSYRLPVVR